MSGRYPDQFGGIPGGVSQEMQIPPDMSQVEQQGIMYSGGNGQQLQSNPQILQPQQLVNMQQGPPQIPQQNIPQSVGQALPHQQMTPQQQPGMPQQSPQPMQQPQTPIQQQQQQQQLQQQHQQASITQAARTTQLQHQPNVLSDPNVQRRLRCGGCGIDINDGDQFIQCQLGCKQVFHQKCSRLTEDAWEQLIRYLRSETPVATWICDKCSETGKIPLCISAVRSNAFMGGAV